MLALAGLPRNYLPNNTEHELEDLLQRTVHATVHATAHVSITSASGTGLEPRSGSTECTTQRDLVRTFEHLVVDGTTYWVCYEHL